MSASIAVTRNLVLQLRETVALLELQHFVETRAFARRHPCVKRRRKFSTKLDGFAQKGHDI